MRLLAKSRASRYASPSFAYSMLGLPLRTCLMRTMRHLIALALVILIGGCATTSPPRGQAPIPSQSPEQYYSQARQAQASGKPAVALDLFHQLESHYPDSPYAQLAPLEIAYARYRLEDYDAAVLEANRFIASHPEHANLDYAFYLKGLIRSAQGTASPKQTPRQAVIVDSDAAREAFGHFSTVVKNFPDSGYRDNALQRMTRLRDLLARHELKQVKEQITRGETEAAVRHAKYIAEQYPKTAAAREALELITSSASTSTTLLEPNIEVMPATKPIAPEAAAESFRREPWLLQQDPQHFTLQIIGSSSRDGIERYIKQHQLEDSSAYFQSRHRDKTWYALLYGNYSSRSAATDAAQRLRQELGLDDIWIRRFNDVHAAIMEGQDH